MLAYRLLSLAPGTSSGADKFREICKAQNLISQYVAANIIKMSLFGNLGDVEECTRFVTNLRAIAKQPQQLAPMVAQILKIEIDKFIGQAKLLVKSFGERQDASDVIAAEDDDISDPGGGLALEENELSFEELASEQVNKADRINNCALVLLNLYLQDSSSIKAKSISKLLRGLCFDLPVLTDLINIEETLEEDDAGYGLDFLPSQEFISHALALSAKLVSEDTSEYKREHFIKDLQYLIHHNLEFNDLRIPMLTDCFIHLDDQDPESARQFALKMLKRAQEGDWSLDDDDLRKIIFEMLGTDKGLVHLIVAEANQNDPACCENLLALLKRACNSTNTDPLLKAVLSHASLDFETLMGKIPSITVNQDDPTLSNILNCFCRHIDKQSGSSIIEQRLVEHTMRSLSSKPSMDREYFIKSQGEGEYRTWLQMVYNLYPDLN